MKCIIPKHPRLNYFSAMFIFFIGLLLIGLQSFVGPLEIQHALAEVGDTGHEHTDFDLCQLLAIINTSTLSHTTLDLPKPYWESSERINLGFLAEIIRFLPATSSPRAPPLL